jgi:hypothetical protein
VNGGGITPPIIPKEKQQKTMKKMLSLMVGLGLVLGTAAVSFAADDAKTDKTDKMKGKTNKGKTNKGKTNKGKTNKTDKTDKTDKSK